MTTNLFDLSGKIALVTGASRGIGEAIALLLAEQGAHVIVSSRKIDGCQLVADKINNAGGSAEALACHVGNMEQIERYLCHYQREIWQDWIFWLTMPPPIPTSAIFSTLISAPTQKLSTLISAVISLCPIEAGKLMRDNGGGAIVNTASVNALQPGMAQGIYSITKAAVVNMTKAFAKECGEFGIRVNALLPGITKTQFAGALFADKEIYQKAVETIPMKRHAEPNEMAGTVLYLVSDASSYTNGECISRRRWADNIRAVAVASSRPA